MIRLLIISALSLSGVATTGIATAEEPLPSIRVSYRDLDLASPSGTATLDRRVRASATRVCTMQYGVSPIQDLHARLILMRCRAIALASARPQVIAAIAGAAALATNHQSAVVAQR